MREKRKTAKVKTSELCCFGSFYKVSRDYLSFFYFSLFFFYKYRVSHRAPFLFSTTGLELHSNLCVFGVCVALLR